MGNQQFLPFILAAVIVALAVVRGMELYREEVDLHQRDEIEKMLMAAALRAQAWYRRPAAMGGGERSFAVLTWAKLNINPVTPNAVLSMSHRRHGSVCLTAVSLADTTQRICYQVYPDSLVLMP